MENILQEELHHYFTRLSEDEKKSVVQVLKTFVQGREEEFERISVEQYNKEIDEAVAEAEAGDYISQEEMERQAAKW